MTVEALITALHDAEPTARVDLGVVIDAAGWDPSYLYCALEQYEQFLAIAGRSPQFEVREVMTALESLL